MWLYCLCGVGNLGPFGGTASGPDFLHQYLFHLCNITHSQHECVGIAKLACVFHNLVFYFVVSSGVHSFLGDL